MVMEARVALSDVKKKGKETAHMQALADTCDRGHFTSRVQIVVLLSALLLALLSGIELANRPDQVKGYEAYRIAELVASGHGYSFKGWRWLFDDLDKVTEPDPTGYHATAWEDPLYTFLLAALMRATGEWHMIAGAILNLVLFIAAVMFTFRLAANCEGVWAGVFAAMLLAAALYFRAHRWLPFLNNTLLATTFVLLFALALDRAVRAPIEETP